MVAVVVDRDHEASAAQLHARARGGPAEGHPLFLHVLVQVEGTLPGFAIVVGVDHLQVAGARRQQRLVRVLAVGQEDVAAGLFLPTLGDGDVTALRDLERCLVSVCVRDGSILHPRVGRALGVVQDVAALLVNAEAGLGVRLTDASREVVDEDDEASVSAVLDDAGVDDGRACCPVTGVGDDCLEIAPRVPAVEGAADREVDRVGRVVRDGLSLIGSRDDDPRGQGDQRGNAVADRVVKTGVKETLGVEGCDRR